MDFVVCGSRADVASSQRENLRVAGQGPGNADALLLAARELRRIVSGAVAEADQFQEGFDFLWMTSFEAPTSSKGKAMFSATVRDERRLKCWKIMPIFLRSARSWDSLILHRSLSSMMTFAAGRFFQHIDAADEGRFAGTALADDAEDLAVFDGQVDAL